ncbi:hypothetical protein [Tropicimonas sp. IMCC34043]|nr:hypothetical protein [Tropicimonas sp. IMCC34043]
MRAVRGGLEPVAPRRGTNMPFVARSMPAHPGRPRHAYETLSAGLVGDD